jgi:predicted amidohydrolase YtcJ
VTADLVVLAPGWTPGGTARPIDAVAVAGDRIVAVDAATARSLTGPRTEIIDAADGLLLPGFVDAHVHAVQGGRNLLTVDLTDAGGLPGYRQRVQAWAAAHPDAPWITGGGWSMEDFPGGLPHRRDLDAVTGDRPAFLYNRDVHSAWVNTAALRVLGIEDSTTDPADGRIERDAAGVATGVLHEGAAYAVERDRLPVPTDAALVDALLAGAAHLHRLGVTSWQDAWVTPDRGRAYTTATRDGRLRSRVVGALWWETDQGPEQIDGLVERRNAGATDLFAPTTVKIMVDGVMENRTGALLEPYCACGGPAGGRGITRLSAEELTVAVDLLERNGFQVHFHAIGDRATRMCLDAVAAARSRRPDPGLRHHVAHLQLVHPADVPRFGALGIAANLQAYWAQHEPQMDELTVPLLGPQRSAHQYPFASLRDTGALLAMGSDWPVSTADPLQQLEVAVRRRDPADRDGRIFLPEQRLALDTALTAFTAGSAAVNHDPDGGALRLGARADLVLLDRDIRVVPDGLVADAQVLATVVGGRVVHAR